MCEMIFGEYPSFDRIMNILEQIEHISQVLDLKVIQLHGDKVRAFCDHLSDQRQLELPGRIASYNNLTLY